MSLEKNALDYSGKALQPAPRELRVPTEMAGLRLDQALARLLPDHSRSRLQDWVRRACVTVDGAAVEPKLKVWGGERIEVNDACTSDAQPQAPQDIPLAIVFEDADLLVLDKPAGLVVHPGSGNPDGTLVNALLHYLPAAAELPRAGIVHRLDKDTSGLMVVAKTLVAHTSLVRQLQARSVSRTYLAFVLGTPPAHGRVDAAIGRHPVARIKMAVVARGKTAITRYRVLHAGDGWSLVECSLETGRTHQIRVHMHSIGHPLLGDPVYGSAKAARSLPAAARTLPRQALHATRLEFAHPVTGAQLVSHSPLPSDLDQLLSVLKQHGQRS